MIVTIHILWALLVVLTPPAVHSTNQTSRAPCRSCVRDADCASGFCDQRQCKETRGALGRRCDPEAEQDAKLAVCGPYVCSEHRCRSCNRNADCPRGQICRDGRCGRG